MKTWIFLFCAISLVAAAGLVMELTRADPPRVCDFEIALDMPPPKAQGMNEFYTTVRGTMAHAKLYTHSWYYVYGGKQSVKHTGLGFECPKKSPFGLEHDANGSTLWMFCELRCTQCGHTARACIERPVISKNGGPD